MHLKRFRGATVREALQAVREELGPDALVLSTRMVSAGGLRGLMGGREVEISAAVEREVSADRQSAPAPAEAPAAPAAPITAAQTDDVVARLMATGLDEVVAREVSGRVTRSRLRKVSGADVRAALTGWAETIAAGDETPAAIDVFVGPPGAGKTTTIAKIAAQQRVRNGRRLSLVSADGFRVGAVEQLRLYAEMIGSPFSAARSAEELERALLAAPLPALVDTAGRSPRDTAAREVLSVLRGMRGVRTHLVIPAGCTAREAGRILDLHEGMRPERVVLTKLDESEPIAPLASFFTSRGLRVSYLGVGQRVPEDLVSATPEALAAALVGDGSFARSAA